MTYRVKEIFGPTIQGEGSEFGCVVKFLRFAGCNRWTGLEKDKAKSICNFCDTDFRGGKALLKEDIILKLNALGPVKHVVVSGGEPLLQLDLELLNALKGDGYRVSIETNGSTPLGDMIHLIDHVTCSPKQVLSETKLERSDDLKILYPPINPGITHEHFKSFKCKARYIQPVWNNGTGDSLPSALDYLFKNPSIKLSLQAHKILGVQ